MAVGLKIRFLAPSLMRLPYILRAQNMFFILMD